MRQKSFISEISVPEEDETSFVSESPSTTNDEFKIKRKSFHAASFKTDNNPELVWSSTNFLFAWTLSQKARMFYNKKNGLAFWYGQHKSWLMILMIRLSTLSRHWAWSGFRPVNLENRPGPEFRSALNPSMTEACLHPSHIGFPINDVTKSFCVNDVTKIEN